MTEEERERLTAEIHRRRMEPGIVLEWHQVEMRRRYELDWERRNEIARQEQERETETRFTDETAAHETPRKRPLVFPTIVTVFDPMQGRLPETLERLKHEQAARARERELVKQRKYREYHEVLDKLPAEELKELSAHLARYGRKFPQTGRSLSKALMAFRSYRKTEAEWDDDVKFYELHMPRETLWSIEMREQTRVAYLSFRMPEARPFSKMLECSVWTGYHGNKLHPPRRIGRPRKEAEIPEW